MIMRLNFLVFTFIASCFLACTPVSNTARNSAGSSDTTDLTKRHTISLMEVTSNQLIINGSNLNSVSSVKAKYGPQVINFNIDSKSNNSLRLSVPNGMKVIAGYIYDLVITDAFGQSVTSVSFDVQDNSISTGKLQDGSVTNTKLSSFGATSGQVLQYNGSTWVAVDYIGGNNYLGRIEVDPGGGITAPTTVGVNNGDYYVVDDAAPVVGDLNGDGSVETFTAGDIIRFNEAANRWDLQINSSPASGLWDTSVLPDLRRVGTGKMTFTNTAFSGPVKLNVGTDSLTNATAEDSILFSVGGDAITGAGPWGRAMSFGLRDEHHATIGTFGASSTTGDYFFIDANNNANGVLAPTFWNSADFYIHNDTGRVGIGGIPTSGALFDVHGDAYVGADLTVVSNITATNFIGDGSALTGVDASSISNTGNTLIKSGANNERVISFEANGSSAMIYDDNGFLSFGHTLDIGSYTADAQLDIRNETSSATAQLFSYSGNASALTLGSSQGTSAAPVGTSIGDILGELNFGGDNGIATSIVTTAKIQAMASENYTTTELGSQLGFFTTQNLTTTPLEKMRLTNDGRLLVGNSVVTDATTRTLVVGGDSLFTGDVNVSGTTSLADANITGTVAHTGNYVLTGDLNVGTNATVTGILTTNGITNSTGNLTNNGPTILTSTLDVSGKATFSGDVEITTGNLDVANLNVTNINALGSTASFGEVSSNTKFVASSSGATTGVLFEDSNRNLQLKLSSGNAQIGNIDIPNGNSFSLWTNAQQRLTINGANGYVGIGTAAPSEELEVNGTIKGTEVCLGAVCRTTWPTDLTSVADGTTIEFVAGVLQVKDAAINNNKLAASGLSASKFTVGTLADARLSTNVSLLGQTIDTTEIVNGTILNVDIDANAQIGWGKIDKTLAVAADVGAIDLANLDTDASLGGATPSATKVPSQDATKTYADAIGAAAAAYTDAQIAGVNQSQWNTSGSNIEYALAGNVGIGTATPTEKLHVVGNLRVEGTTDCTLGGGAGATNCTSDRRLKDNIENIDHALDKIKALNGVSFDWNEKSISPGVHSIGVIAQDVQAQFPTAVIENSEGWLAVDYAVLVSPLIEAVKELDHNIEMYKLMSEGIESKVEDNSRAIASLKEENDKLKQENQQMKQALCSLNDKFEFCK